MKDASSLLRTTAIVLVGFTAPVFATTLTDAETRLATAPQDVQNVLNTAPKTYIFKHAANGVVNSYYDGQTFRQVTIHDFAAFIKSLNAGQYTGSAEEARLALDSYFTYSPDNANVAEGVITGFSTFQIIAKDLLGNNMPIAEGEYYDDLGGAGKMLRNKLAGNNKPLSRGQLLGFNSTTFQGIDLSQVDADQKADAFIEPEDFVEAVLGIIANQAASGAEFTITNGNGSQETISEAYITADGVNLAALLEKFFHGAVSFSQAAENYLSTNNILNADNSNVDPNRFHTNLEHNWDEGFGYYGATPDYFSLDKSTIAADLSTDSNQDGAISILNEKSFYFTVESARRDLSDQSGQLNMADKIILALLQGRHMIQKQPHNYRNYVADLSTVVLGYWEMSMAATSIHYLNMTLANIDVMNDANYSFKDYASNWSQLKGLSLGMQFKPEPLISEADFVKLHQLIGDAPALNGSTVSQFRAQLVSARDLLIQVYGFDKATAEGF